MGIESKIQSMQIIVLESYLAVYKQMWIIIVVFEYHQSSNVNWEFLISHNRRKMNLKYILYQNWAWHA